MARIETQIEIEAAAHNVFRFCHDMERRAEWDERVTRTQVLTSKPIRRGTLIRFDTRPAMGSVFSWEGEMVEYDFPSGSRLEVVDVAPSSTFVSGSETWRFTSSGGTGGATSFRLIWDYKPRGIVGSIVDLLMRRGATRRAIKDSLQNVKTLLESKS